jgi:hypothetical protein
MSSNVRRSENHNLGRFALPLSAVLSLLVAAGCGSSNALNGQTLYPVKGKILLHNGKPLTSGRVAFFATGSTLTSTATIESDGGFAFKSPSGDGLPEGQYRVVIDPGLDPPSKSSRSKTKLNLPFAARYTDEDGSDLKATVTRDESKNNFEFTLDAK